MKTLIVIIVVVFMTMIFIDIGFASETGRKGRERAWRRVQRTTTKSKTTIEQRQREHEELKKRQKYKSSQRLYKPPNRIVEDPETVKARKYDLEGTIILFSFDYFEKIEQKSKIKYTVILKWGGEYGKSIKAECNKLGANWFLSDKGALDHSYTEGYKSYADDNYVVARVKISEKDEPILELLGYDPRDPRECRYGPKYAHHYNRNNDGYKWPINREIIWWVQLEKSNKTGNFPPEKKKAEKKK